MAGTAVFGGTFNPIHYGHLLLADDVRERLRLERVLFVPAGVPPHKSVAGLASAADRYQMVKLATAGGDEILRGANVTAPYFTAVRDALDHWRRGAAPPISVHDCARAVRLIDQAYERAG